MKDLLYIVYRSIDIAKGSGKSFVRLNPIKMEHVRDRDIQELRESLREADMNLGVIEDYRNGTIVFTINWEK